MALGHVRTLRTGVGDFVSGRDTATVGESVPGSGSEPGGGRGGRGEGRRETGRTAERTPRPRREEVHKVSALSARGRLQGRPGEPGMLACRKPGMLACRKPGLRPPLLLLLPLLGPLGPCSPGTPAAAAPADDAAELEFFTERPLHLVSPAFLSFTIDANLATDPRFFTFLG